ncbi:MAG: hypothetical protein WCG78_02765 [Candidatus Omnitrophota bacterium]
MKTMLLYLFCCSLLCPIAAHAGNADERWECISAGLKDQDILAIAPGPGTTFYACSSKSIYRTRNNGCTWEELDFSAGPAAHLTSLACTAVTSRLFAGTDNGLFSSDDAGITWKKITAGIKEGLRNISAIEIAESDPSFICAATADGILISEDIGTTWRASFGIISGGPITSVTIDRRDRSTIYAAAAAGLFRSKDRGRAWECLYRASISATDEEAAVPLPDLVIEEPETSSPRVPRCIVTDRENAHHLYLGTTAGVIVSYDGGATFRPVSRVGMGSKRIISLLAPIGKTLYAATDRGVFKTVEPYRRWTAVYRGLDSRQINALRYIPETNSIVAATSQGIFRVTPATASEEPLPSVAASDPASDHLMSRFIHEPSIKKVQQQAIRYAEVHQEKIAQWRSLAKRRALLPTISVGVNRDTSNKSELYTSATTHYCMTGPDDISTGWDVRASWDLGNLIWSDDQTNIDVRSRLTVQLRDDIVTEVTRLYFERRRLQIDLLLSPPQNLRNKVEKELRLEELTAGIDALTGGWFAKGQR